MFFFLAFFFIVFCSVAYRIFVCMLLDTEAFLCFDIIYLETKQNKSAIYLGGFFAVFFQLLLDFFLLYCCILLILILKKENKWKHIQCKNSCVAREMFVSCCSIIFFVYLLEFFVFTFIFSVPCVIWTKWIMF